MSRKSLLIAIVAIIALVLVGWGSWALMEQRSSESDSKPDQLSTSDLDQEQESEKDPEAEGLDEPSETTFTPILYYVATDDNGMSGELIGCGDSLMRVEGEITQASDVVVASFEALLGNQEREIGQSGLYNALYQSDLSISHWAKDGDMITVDLTGSLKSGGACDDARITKQLESTAAMAAGASQATILVDGTPIEEILSGQ